MSTVIINGEQVSPSIKIKLFDKISKSEVKKLIFKKNEERKANESSSS